MTTDWTVSYGTQKIAVNMGHIEQAVDAACSVLTKELAFNDKVKDSPAQTKAYNIHIEVLRLLESVFKQGFDAYAEHQRKQIPRKRS